MSIAHEVTGLVGWGGGIDDGCVNTADKLLGPALRRKRLRQGLPLSLPRGSKLPTAAFLASSHEARPAGLAGLQFVTPENDDYDDVLHCRCSPCQPSFPNRLTGIMNTVDPMQPGPP